MICASRNVRRKNFKDRYVNITGECTKVILEYLKVFPRKDEDMLFTTIVKKQPLKTGDKESTSEILLQEQKSIDEFIRIFYDIV